MTNRGFTQQFSRLIIHEARDEVEKTFVQNACRGHQIQVEFLTFLQRWEWVDVDLYPTVDTSKYF